MNNLRYICFEDTYMNKTIIDIQEGRTCKYEDYLNTLEEEQTVVRIPDAEPNDITVMHPSVDIPYLNPNAMLTKETLAYFCEEIAVQVLREDYIFSETLLNKIEVLELKVQELEMREEKRNWEEQTGIFT